MANAIYWDTSALLKHFAPEPDSSDYLRLLIQQPEDLAVSFLHRVKLYFALCGRGLTNAPSRGIRPQHQLGGPEKQSG